MIEQLPLLTPDPERGRRLTARCHERLAVQQLRINNSAQEALPSFLWLLLHWCSFGRE